MIFFFLSRSNLIHLARELIKNVYNFKFQSYLSFGLYCYRCLMWEDNLEQNLKKKEKKKAPTGIFKLSKVVRPVIASHTQFDMIQVNSRHENKLQQQEPPPPRPPTLSSHSPFPACFFTTARTIWDGPVLFGQWRKNVVWVRERLDAHIFSSVANKATGLSFSWSDVKRRLRCEVWGFLIRNHVVDNNKMSLSVH